MDLAQTIASRMGATFIGWCDYLFVLMWRTIHYYKYLDRGFIDDD